MASMATIERPALWKRLGWLATVVFYGLNGVDLQAPDDAAFDLVIAIASGRADHHEAARHLAQWH